MKNLTPNPFRFIPAALGLVFCLLAHHAGAAVLYFDPNGASAVTSGTYTWNTTSSQWATSSTLNAGITTWNTADAANFCAGTYTGSLTVDVNSAIPCAGFFNGSLTGYACTLTIGGTGSLTLPASATPGIYTSSSGSTTIAVPITGPSSTYLVLEGSGQVYLNGANTYSGGTSFGLSGTAFGGTVNFNSSSSFGSSGGGITLLNCSGCAVVAEGSSAITIPNNFSVSASTTVNFVGNTAGVTYSGTWSLGANTLTFETGNTAGNIDNITGIISGTGGGLTVSDLGTLVLSGVNSYSGATTVSGGKLIGVTGGSCANSAVTVSSAGLGVSIPNNAQQWTCSGLTFGSGTTTLDFNFGYSVPSTTLAPLKVSATPAFTVKPTVTVEAANLPAGSSGPYPLMAWPSGTPSGAPTTVSLGTRATGNLSVSSGTLNLNVTANTEPLTWAVTAGSGNWDINTSQNWKDSSGAAAYYLQTTLPGDAVVFSDNNITASPTINLGTTVTPASVTVNNSQYNYTISGTGGITGGAALSKQGTATLTLSGANTYTGGTTIQAGQITVAGNCTTSGGPLGENTSTYTYYVYLGDITGSANATLMDTYSSTTYNLSLTVQAGSSGTKTLGVSGSSALTWGGPVLLNDSLTLNSGSGSGSIVVGGAVTGSGGVTVSSGGTGYVELSKASSGNTYAGNTTISQGTLRLGSASAIPSGTGKGYVILNPTSSTTATLDLYGQSPTINGLSSSGAGSAVVDNTSGTSTYTLTVGTSGSSPSTTFAGVIQNTSGTLSLTKAGSGTLTLSGANTYSGNTTVSGGILNAGIAQSGTTSGPLGASGTITFSGGTLQLSSASATWDPSSRFAAAQPWNVDVNGQTVSFATALTGAGSLTLTGTGGGTLTLTGGNTYSGATTINSGTLAIGTAGYLGASGSYAGNITDTGAFVYNSSAAQTLSGVISGAGTLTVQAGTLILSGANTYTGSTTLSGGIVNLNHSETAGTSGPLGNHSDTVAGSLIMSGGTLQYSTANNNHDYSGRFSTAANQLYNIDVNSRSVTYATALTSSGGALTLSDTAGGGTLTLSKANTYSGGTTINSGTLDVTGSIAGNVTVNGGVLELGKTTALASTATLNLPSAPVGVVNLAFSGTQNISALNIGGTSMAQGTWGSTTSTAAHQNAAFTSNGLLNITSGGTSQTITFNNPGAQTYGVAPITLPLNASSGLPITYTVTAGSSYASVSGNTLTITGAGSVTVQATQAGNNTVNAATPVSQTFTVNPLPVQLTGTRPYDGGTDAGYAILSVANKQGSDTVNVASGSGTLAGANAGAQAITSVGSLALGNNTAGDYTLANATGSVTITAASSTNNLAASPNPTLPSQDMTFTATLSALPPGAGTPTGNVLFKTNGVYVLASDDITPEEFPLTNGVATLTLPAGALPHGDNTITNEYAGDGNFLGSTNGLVQLVNTPPISANITASAQENQPMVLYTVMLLANASDADGDPLSITAAGPPSVNGGTVALDNPDGIITYTPALNYAGSDSFTYTVSDNYGGTCTPTVSVTVNSTSTGGVSLDIVVPPAYSNGAFTVIFAGIPGITYTVQTATSLNGSWSFFETATAGTNGLFTVTDTEASSPQRYYRIVYIPGP